MKKILLSVAFLGATFIGAKAQTVVWSEDFNDANISSAMLSDDGWTFIDSDGDGLNWGDLFNISPGGGGAPIFTTPAIVSRSWQVNALTPDNWVISPAIDLTNVSGTITLSWKVRVAAASWSLENYSVYAANINLIMDLVTSPTTFTEVYPGGTTGNWLDRTLDLSSFAGQIVYVAFRHHDCSDQDFLAIDDIVVTAGDVSVDSHLASSFSIYPNPATDVINISNGVDAIENVKITDLNGRVVKEITLGIDQSQINISDLAEGVYVLNATSNGKTITEKIVKK